MQKQIDFFNTTNLQGSELKAERKNAQNQDDRIMAFFRNHPDKDFTPFEVRAIAFIQAVPITSVRRSLTNLTNKGFLIKTENKKIGVYGKKNYCWKLK